MKILGIESSCDETSVAIVEDGCLVLSNRVYSQIELHARFTGVVPEIASRNHLLKILEILNDAMQETTFDEIDTIAVTNGPGLIGSLLIGVSTAKALSYALKKPLVPVNHILGHLYAPHLSYSIDFPYIGLVASGGHTLLFEVHSHSNIQVLGSTIDDAVGEAFDKVAKLLGLGYPGGPVIDKMAKEGNAKFLSLPRGLPDNLQDRYNFSYSGLKTAVAYRVRDLTLSETVIRDVAASFQQTAIEMLYRKTRNALQDKKIKNLVVSGGVAANSGLRDRFADLEKEGFRVFTADIPYCGDNAAMIAGRGYQDYLLGERGGLEMAAYSRLPYITKGKRPVRNG